MQTDESRRQETETLIRAIWGPTVDEPPQPPIDPVVRARQNRALADALKAYLRQYLSEV